jgi:hypothetical protein
MVMSKRCWGLLLVVGCLLLVACGSGSGDKITSFSARQACKKSRGWDNKVYVSDGKMRIEIGQGGADRFRIVMIFRPDKKLCWTLFPAQKTYVESPLDEGEMRGAMGLVPPGCERKELGRETVNGFDCRKYRIESVNSHLGRKSKLVSTVWLSERIDLPLRVVNRDRSAVDLVDIKPGPQPESLFVVPEGYQKKALLGAGHAAPHHSFGSSAKKGSALPFKMPHGFKIPFTK